jgi:hypothetical protein
MEKLPSNRRMKGPMAQDRVVVLGLGQQQGAAAFDVAQVDVVAQGGAHDLAAAVHGQHDLGFGVVPAGFGQHADLRARPHRGHGRRLGEDLGVGTYAHLQVLRPLAALDQFGLQPGGLGRARAQARQVGADQRLHADADFLGAAGVAARLFLDHPLQQADGEGDARRLDGLQVARRQQPGAGLSRQVRGHQGARVAQRFPCGAGGQRHAVRAVQQVRHGGRNRGDVDHLTLADRHHAGAVHRPRPPYPPHQQRLFQIGWQRLGLVHVTPRFLV